MDKRLRKISKQLTDYARGDFRRQMSVSAKADDIDAIISGINMLGEEMKAATISRDYFNNIFNSVSDMVFVLDSRGIIQDLNEAVCKQLGYLKEQMIGQSVCHIQPKVNGQLTLKWLTEVKRSGYTGHKNVFFQTAFEKQIPVQVSVTAMLGEHKRATKILLTAKDITRQIQNENTVIRAIIDAQEKERKRIAEDIHDGLGQKLSAIKFFIGSIAYNCTDEIQKTKLMESNKELIKAISEMYNICFDLLPATLNEFGLLQAIKELCCQPEYKSKVHFILKEDRNFPALSKDMEIDIYRVIQEFITNAIKHGQAKNILIQNSYFHNKIGFLLKDDGKGFDTEKPNFTGRGLQNAHSRIKSYHGQLVIKSVKGKGTAFKFMIPLN